MLKCVAKPEVALLETNADQCDTVQLRFRVVNGTGEEIRVDVLPSTTGIKLKRLLLPELPSGTQARHLVLKVDAHPDLQAAGPI